MVLLTTAIANLSLDRLLALHVLTASKLVRPKAIDLGGV
jgi:hypothetical protein